MIYLFPSFDGHSVFWIFCLEHICKTEKWRRLLGSLRCFTMWLHHVEGVDGSICWISRSGKFEVTIFMVLWWDNVRPFPFESDIIF